MPEIQEEEIDLREYINVLLKRKGIIILIFLIAVITAAIVSYFVLTPIYQSSSTFRIARVDNVPVLNISESLELIKGNQILNEAAKNMNLDASTFPLKPQINSENLPGTNFIKINVEANTPIEAKKLAENIVEIFIKENQSKYLEKIKLIEDKLEELEYRMVELGENISEIEKAKKTITASKELSEAEKQFQVSLLLSSSSTTQKLYSDLTEQIYALQERLSSCEDFKIINYAQLSTAPIKPNKKLNILIAGVLGLFVGIFVAFFLEFWQKGKS